MTEEKVVYSSHHMTFHVAGRPAVAVTWGAGLDTPNHARTALDTPNHARTAYTLACTVAATESSSSRNRILYHRGWTRMKYAWEPVI